MMRLTLSKRPLYDLTCGTALLEELGRFVHVCL